MHGPLNVKFLLRYPHYRPTQCIAHWWARQDRCCRVKCDAWMVVRSARRRELATWNLSYFLLQRIFTGNIPLWLLFKRTCSAWNLSHPTKHVPVFFI